MAIGYTSYAKSATISPMMSARAVRTEAAAIISGHVPYMNGSSESVANAENEIQDTSRETVKLIRLETVNANVFGILIAFHLTSEFFI